MRVSEMCQRESFHEIFDDTLSTWMSMHYGKEVSVSSNEPNKGQIWLYHPFLSAYYTSDCSKMVRHFLRDMSRFTPVVWRRIPQWIYVSSICTPLGINLFGKGKLTISPSINGSSDLVILPGNKRIRIFDFNAGSSWVISKKGFDTAGMKAEICTRLLFNDPGTLPITDYADDYSWLKEPILNGFPLPRLPFSAERRGVIERQSVSYLAKLLNGSHKTVLVEHYGRDLITSIVKKSEKVQNRYNVSCNKIIKFSELILNTYVETREVVVSDTHGDFQPGNIMYDKQTDQIYIIDWEHCKQRSCYYDFFTYHLKSRAGGGLASRYAESFSWSDILLNEKQLPVSEEFLSYISLFALEELDWYLSESLAGPFNFPSMGLANYIKEIPSILQIFEVSASKYHNEGHG
jgi:hypothetical protein